MIVNTIQQNFKKLVDKNITVIFIHHHGKEGQFARKGNERLRGSSDILAMLDSLLMIDKVNEKRNIVYQGAVRLGKPIEPFYYEIESAENSLTLSFIGQADVKGLKLDDAKEYILKLLETDSLRHKDIVSRLLNAEIKFSQTTIKNAISELRREKQIVKLDDNNYSLPDLGEVLK